MDIFIKILQFVLSLSILVLFHEFGHFLLAKKNGITVVEFSLGMGPRLLSFDKGGTKYSLGGICQNCGYDR